MGPMLAICSPVPAVAIVRRAIWNKHLPGASADAGETAVNWSVRPAAAPPVEAYSDRNEDLLGRLLCVTAHDDAFAPAGILGAARDLRPNRSVGGAMSIYSQNSHAERSAWLYDPSVSHGQHESWQLKVFVSDASLIVPKLALRNRTIVVTCKVTTLAELPKYKLPPRDNRSAEQALPLRQMPIKSVIPVWTFLSFTEVIPQ